MQGIGWVASSTWSMQAVRLATLTVLANLIAPDTFGFFAFALAIFTIAQPIVGLGLSGVIVVVPELKRDTVATSLALATITALAGMIVMAVGLAVMQTLDPQLPQLGAMAVMIPGLLFTNIANVALAVPRRAKQFRQLGLAMLVSEAVGSATGIAIAVSGDGMEALVWRYVSSSAVMALIGLWLVRSHMTMPRPSSVRSLLIYGLPIGGSELLAALRNRGDELFIGALFGAVVLGIYSIARRYVDALRAALPAVVGEHAWPVLASLRDHRAGFAKQLRRSLLLIGAFAWPIFVALAALASLWVPVVLGSDWSPTVVVIQVLCLVAIIQSAVAIPVLATVGLGFTAARLRIDLALTVVTVLAIAAFAPLGMIGLLAAILFANLVVLPYQYRVVSRILPIPLHEVLPVLLLPLITNAILAVALVLVVRSLPQALGVWPTLVCGIALSGLVPLAELVRRRVSASRETGA